ncbi:hypothetical protein CCACVL1_27996, partial [Corchorus capsularis]
HLLHHDAELDSPPFDWLLSWQAR